MRFLAKNRNNERTKTKRKWNTKIQRIIFRKDNKKEKKKKQLINIRIPEENNVFIREGMKLIWRKMRKIEKEEKNEWNYECKEINRSRN